MKENEYLEYDLPNNETTSFKVGTMTVPAPVFVPEVKGKEDIQILLKFSNAIPKGNPIIVPENRWMQLINHPTIANLPALGDNITLQKFLSNHPLLFYDPPELFRNSYPDAFVKYALQGDKTKRRKFNNHVIEGENKKQLNWFRHSLDLLYENKCKI